MHQFFDRSIYLVASRQRMTTHLIVRNLFYYLVNWKNY